LRSIPFACKIIRAADPLRAEALAFEVGDRLDLRAADYMVQRLVGQNGELLERQALERRGEDIAESQRVLDLPVHHRRHGDLAAHLNQHRLHAFVLKKSFHDSDLCRQEGVGTARIGDKYFFRSKKRRADGERQERQQKKDSLHLRKRSRDSEANTETAHSPIVSPA
jgi:hypothetical protein